MQDEVLSTKYELLAFKRLYFSIHITADIFEVLLTSSFTHRRW